MIIAGIKLTKPSGFTAINSDPKELLSTGTFINPDKAPLHSYSLNEIESTYKSIKARDDFGGYDYDNLFWTCHERALYGVAQARYYCPGIKIAIANGERNINNVKENHTVIVNWIRDSNDWFFYDPGVGIINAEDFEATKIVPIPVPGLSHNSNLTPGFEKFKLVEKGLLVLSPNYDPERNREAVLGELQSLTNRIRKLKDEFKVPANVDQVKFENSFIRHDRVLWECMLLRYKYKGFPIGMSFGKFTDEKGTIEGAAFAYWDNPNSNPKYWGLYTGDFSKSLNAKFDPRIIIV